MSKVKNIVLIAIFSLFLLAPSLVLAQVNTNIGDPATTKCGVNQLCNPLAGVASTPQQLIGKIIDSVMGVVGSIALLMFVYGGLVWMTSSGNAEKIKQGEGILMWSAIGLAVVFSSYALVRVVLSALTKAN
ncbi:MAG: pilin [Patescibacteria group bacterium]